MPDARHGRDLARLLQQGRLGTLLIGPGAACGRIERQALDRQVGQQLLPVRFSAVGGTVESLRELVHRGHAARPEAASVLLLVIEHAERLGTPLLRELELAAEAAGQHGGLRFLFTAAHPFDNRVRDLGLYNLGSCLLARLEIGPGLSPRRPLLWAGAVLAGLAGATVLALGIDGARQGPAIVWTPPGVHVARRMPVEAAPTALRAPAMVSFLATPLPTATPQPASLLLIAAPGDTLSSLYDRVYRGPMPPSMREVKRLNPTPVRPGLPLVFPAPAAGWTAEPGPS